MKKYFLFLVAISFFFNAHAQGGWTFGAEKGHAMVSGEISPLSGFAFGFFAEKHLGQIASARLQWGMGDVRGQSRTATLNWKTHPVWNGGAGETIDYDFANVRYIFANYQTVYMEGSLQGVFHITRLPFLKNNSPFDLYLLGGISGMRYMTQIDALDAGGGLYDFSRLKNLSSETRPRALANLSGVMDGDYETAVQNRPVISPMYQAGAGLRWKIRDRLSLSLSHRVSFTNTDNLDSYQWNAGNDRHHYTSLSIGYTLARRKETPAGIITGPGAILASPIEPDLVDIPLTTTEEDVVRKAFDNLEFETNQAIIRRESFASLNELATLLAGHPGWKLSISGHTDDVGEEAFNLDLSKRRAEAVRDYLAGRGIAAGRFYVSWYGESRPIADNLTEEGRQRNRRVEMKIVE